MNFKQCDNIICQKYINFNHFKKSFGNRIRNTKLNKGLKNNNFIRKNDNIKTNHQKRICASANTDIISTKSLSSHGNKGDYECDVRILHSLDWISVEMIGTMEGKQAEKASRLIVYHEYYKNRGKLLLSLYKHLLSTEKEIPIDKDKIKKISELEEKYINPVIKILDVIDDWIIINLYTVGYEETKSTIEKAIAQSKKQALEIVNNYQLKLIDDTVSISTDQIFFKLNKIENKRQKIYNNQTENGYKNEIQKEISIPLRELIFLECRKHLIDKAIQYAESSKEINQLEYNEVCSGGSRILGADISPISSRYSFRCFGNGIKDLREKINKGENILYCVEPGVKDPFDDITETDIFGLFGKTIERCLQMPRPLLAWISIRFPQYEKPKEDIKEEDEEFKSFKILSIDCEKKDTNWYTVKFKPLELLGLITGICEYFCNDMDLREKFGKEATYYLPRDLPVRLSIRPNDVVFVEMKKNGVKYERELNEEMLREILLLADEVVEGIPGYVNFVPPGQDNDEIEGND